MGSKTFPLGAQRPEKVAARTLPKIVKEWQREQERDRLRLQRNAERLAAGLRSKPSKPRTKA